MSVVLFLLALWSIASWFLTATLLATGEARYAGFMALWSLFITAVWGVLAA